MLAIFDIDGTLIRSTHIDDECFTIALDRVLGIRGFDTDWANYTHSTDDGLILEIAERYGRFTPSPQQIDDAKAEFFAQLRRAVAAAIAGATSPCTQIDGVARMLDAVRSRAGWSVGISSGTSAEAAAIKLGAAGLSLDGLPATFSHRCPRTHAPASRAQIIRCTREKTLAASRVAASASPASLAITTPTVYIGDGLWDLRAAKELGIGFVGIRHDGNESKLRAEGATRIVHHYRDLTGFLAHLEEAAA